MTHRSFSQKSGLLWCGHQYWLTRIAKAPETPSWSLIGGKAVHTVAEYLGKAKSQEKIATEIEIWELWRQAFASEIMAAEDASGLDSSTFRAAGRKTAKNPAGEDYDWWLVEGEAMCQRYRLWLETCNMGIAVLDGVPAIEMEVSTSFGDVQVKSFLDLVVEYGTEAPYGLMVVDVKTGQKPASTEQLGQYASQIEQLFGVRPAYGAYWMARTGELTTPDLLDRWSIEHFTKQYAIVDKTITQGLFLPRVGTHCVACPVARFCKVNGGEDAALYEETE